MDRSFEKAILTGQGMVLPRVAFCLVIVLQSHLLSSLTAFAQTNNRDEQTDDNYPSKSLNENLAGFTSGTQSGDGGGSFADFQSLIDLIQTTVVPDTWEALGGPSTMAPYPQGVFVDSSGTLLDCQPILDTPFSLGLTRMKGEGLSRLNQPLAKGSGSWKQPSEMRFVSLRRLVSQWNQWQQTGISPSDAMRNLAGLSEVQTVFLEESDIVLAGRVNGIHQQQGWFRDLKTHRNTIQLEFLRVALWSSLAKQPFGCTIDPTREGLIETARVGQQIQQKKIPIGDASEALISALGLQRVEVFGVPGDTPIGYVLVEADRHMKQLALGQHPMPNPAINYLDAIDATIAQGPPQELLLRLWFTAQRRQVFSNQDQSIFEIEGQPIRLSSENERAQRNGARGNVTRDPRTESFVESFNLNWRSICEDYPIYGAVESIFEAASIGEHINRFSQSPDQMRIIETLVNGATSSPAILSTPRQVASIGTMHTVRHGNKRHHVLLASGGVLVDSSQIVDEVVIRYPLRTTHTPDKASYPRVEQRWWWDAPTGSK